VLAQLGELKLYSLATFVGLSAGTFVYGARH